MTMFILPRNMFRSLIPAAFVLVWSTGFIVARAVTSHADVQWFLLWRFVAVATMFGAAAIAGKASWPSLRAALKHFGVGATMMGLYLTVSYWAIAHGLPAGIMALMGALQPLLTAGLMLATHRQRPSAALWAGLGTLAQKRVAKDDLRIAGCLQNIGAALIALLAVAIVGAVRWDGSAPLWGLLMWSALVTSVLSQSLLMWMLRHGEATRVTTLMLLVPPVAAILAYALFHETLTWLQLTGLRWRLRASYWRGGRVPRSKLEHQGSLWREGA